MNVMPPCVCARARTHKVLYGRSWNLEHLHRRTGNKCLCINNAHVVSRRIRFSHKNFACGFLLSEFGFCVRTNFVAGVILICVKCNAFAFHLWDYCTVTESCHASGNFYFISGFGRWFRVKYIGLNLRRKTKTTKSKKKKRRRKNIVQLALSYTVESRRVAQAIRCVLVGKCAFKRDKSKQKN